MNFIYLLNDPLKICENLQPVWTIFGYIIFGIKVVVPLLLIITGMITMAQAVMKQEEKDIKKAQQTLIHKIIAAVIVFLVVQIVTIVVGIVGNYDKEEKSWNECAKCALHPFRPGNECSIFGNDTDTPTENTENTENNA